MLRRAPAFAASSPKTAVRTRSSMDCFMTANSSKIDVIPSVSRGTCAGGAARHVSRNTTRAPAPSLPLGMTSGHVAPDRLHERGHVEGFEHRAVGAEGAELVGLDRFAAQ